MKLFITFISAFLLFGMAQAQSKLPVVMLDCYFNHETRVKPDGSTERFHYIWEETDQPGWSILASVFKEAGAKTASLEMAPDKSNLKGADIYIIVDPDNLKDNPKPNTIQKNHAAAIKDWVSKGGVLVLMGNDTANCDLPGLNRIAGEFGIKFTDKNRNMVVNNQLEMGKVMLDVPNEIFSKTKKAYLKEISIIEVEKPAKAVISKDGEVIIAVSGIGKGTVFAVGDPWLYNEYVDGKKLPAEYENLNAAKELVSWLITRIPENKGK